MPFALGSKARTLQSSSGEGLPGALGGMLSTFMA